MVYIFNIRADEQTQEEVSIFADSQEQAELELRVQGIVYCGGVSFSLKKIIAHKI